MAITGKRCIIHVIHKVLMKVKWQEGKYLGISLLVDAFTYTKNTVHQSKVHRVE